MRVERRECRVLFLNPPDLEGGVWMKEVGRCGRKAIGGEIWPQTGLAYLAAMAEREGAVCRVVDGMAESWPLDRLVALCREWRPALIVANSATPTLRNDARVLAELQKAAGALGVFVGPHVSALPRETLLETGAELGLVNEAEETVAELVRLLLTRMNEANPAVLRVEDLEPELATIQGVVRKSGGEIVLNPSRPMIADLDALPPPARRLLPNHAYRMPFFGDHPFATVIPARGCPWPCSFCRAGRVWGRRVRSRSVEGVLDEIRLLREELGIRHLVFMTDSLTLDRNWARRLFEALMELPEKPEWICNSRVDVVDAEMLDLMKRANCRMISYGLESGSAGILERCRKGIRLEQSERAIRLTREAGIPSMGYFIIGLPGETVATIRESIKFAKRVRPDYVNFHVATPFPGTDLYEEALEKGWLTSDRWEDFEEEGSAVLQAGDLTPAELKIWQARAMRGFYMRPGRLARELLSLRGWSDLKSKARAGWRMLSTLGTGK